MPRRSDRLSLSRGLQQPAWRRCMPARTPRIRKDVLRIRAQAGSPPSLVHRLAVAWPAPGLSQPAWRRTTQPTQQTAKEKRHERSHP